MPAPRETQCNRRWFARDGEPTPSLRGCPCRLASALDAPPAHGGALDAAIGDLVIEAMTRVARQLFVREKKQGVRAALQLGDHLPTGLR